MSTNEKAPKDLSIYDWVARGTFGACVAIALSGRCGRTVVDGCVGRVGRFVRTMVESFANDPFDLPIGYFVIVVTATPELVGDFHDDVGHFRLVRNSTDDCVQRVVGEPFAEVKTRLVDDKRLAQLFQKGLKCLVEMTARCVDTQVGGWMWCQYFYDESQSFSSVCLRMWPQPVQRQDDGAQEPTIMLLHLNVNGWGILG